MRTTWHDIWGSARGPIRRLAPQSRILCGVGLFASCMIAPATTLLGSCVIVSITVAWGGLCRPPLKVVRSSVLLGLALFLPFFLLIPLIREQGAGPDWGRSLVVLWVVVLRGMAGMQVSILTVTSLTASELRQGLVRIPVPEVIAAVLLQIVHQASTLIYETRRVAAAIAVRSGSSGVRTAVRLLAALPGAWLPRIITRADRVAAAMEVRGYCQRDLRALDGVSLEMKDILALLVASSVLMAAIVLRACGDP